MSFFNQTSILIKCTIKETQKLRTGTAPNTNLINVDQQQIRFQTFLLKRGEKIITAILCENLITD